VPRYFALVPAAGAGRRVAGQVPKQYQKVAGRPLLHHALRALSAEARIERIFVVVAPDDTRHDEACVDLERVTPIPCGGETRAASVRNGLAAAAAFISAHDWVLVHDAARPGLSPAALSRLIAEVGDDDAGGLLALPVADTLKRGGSDDRVLSTEPRAGLWQAQTPQMFRYALLAEALARAGDGVTDEASAIERLGRRPRLVMGEARNFKVTYPEDLELARAVLVA